MPVTPVDLVTQADIEAFQQDGAVVMRGLWGFGLLRHRNQQTGVAR